MNNIPEHDAPVIVWTDFGDHPKIARCWHMDNGEWFMWVLGTSCSYDEYMDNPDTWAYDALSEEILYWANLPEEQFEFKYQ